MSNDPNRCAQMVMKGFHSYQCYRKPNAELGTGYCKIHDPETVKRKRNALRDKWDAEFAERDRLNAIAAAKREAGVAAIEVCRMLLENHPDDLDARILAKAIIDKLDKASKENG